MSQPSSEPIRDVAHIGHFELFTPELSQSLFYFQELLGMTVVHNEGPSYYLRGYGDYAVSTLKLTESEQPGVGRIAWRMVSPQALVRRAKAIEQTGLAVGWSNGEFGRGRVIDTPISESAFIGAAGGAAATGMRPVVDLMFVDFVGVCFDQIFNQMAKFRYMFGGKSDTPVVILAMIGAGLRAGAQHSQMQIGRAHV